MAKVVLEYDEVSGNLTDGNGTFLLSWVGLVPVEEYKGSVSNSSQEDLSKLIKLKAMGFEVEDMERINNLGLL